MKHLIKIIDSCASIVALFVWHRSSSGALVVDAFQYPCNGVLLSSSPSIRRSSSCFKPRLYAEKNNDEKPGWLEDAMSGFKTDDPNPDSNNRGSEYLESILPLSVGLAGFAMDPDQGFVAVLSKREGDLGVFTSVVVSPSDKTQLQSAEALTLVQLAGGLDLGTAVLPPDTLAELVRARLLEDEEDEDNSTTVQEALRPVVSLSTISMIPNPDYSSSIEDNKRVTGDLASSSPGTTSHSSSPGREAAIQASLLKVTTAVRGLRGLTLATEDQVRAALEEHADVQGQLDRMGFADVLNSLRQIMSPSLPTSPVMFVLTSNVIQADAIRQVSVPTTNALQALGLALRYKIRIDTTTSSTSTTSSSTPAHKEEGGSIPWTGRPECEILKVFPAFRPIQELYEDAATMDGFIPNVFQQRNKPIDNDMKG